MDGAGLASGVDGRVVNLNSFGKIKNSASTQPTEGGKKRIFGIFEGFFDLYAPQTRHFVRFCGVCAAAQIFDACSTFCGTFCGKILRKCAAKMPQLAVPQKRCKILQSAVFAAFLGRV